jgi:hypothetical protein
MCRSRLGTSSSTTSSRLEAMPVQAGMASVCPDRHKL